MKDKRAAFLGRFQPLHLGHYFTVEDFSEEYGDFVLVIGSPEKSRTEKNPLNLEERKELLDSCFPGIEKVPVKDEDRGKKGYPDWAKRFMEKTEADVVITGNERVKEIIKDYTEASVREIDLYCPEKFSGTRIREKIRKNENWVNLVPECSRKRIEEFTDVIKEVQR